MEKPNELMTSVLSDARARNNIGEIMGAISNYNRPLSKDPKVLSDEISRLVSVLANVRYALSCVVVDDGSEDFEHYIKEIKSNLGGIP
jgi:hypothetical protein